MRQSIDMNSSFRKPKSLYRELTKTMIVLVSLVSIGVNLFNYFDFARQTEALYENKMSEYVVHLRESLEWPLWNIDDEMIVKIGSAFASHEEIATLTIRDDQQRVVYHQEKPNGNQLKRKIAIEHNGQNIGSVEIGLSLSVHEERERRRRLSNLATMVLLIVVLLIVMRWILSKLLKKSIDAFVGATGEMVEGKYQQVELPETYVEFAPILSGFKAMSDAVASRESSLCQSNEHLAAEIDERKHAEEALRASEERWQFALDGAGDGVWDWDVQTNQTIFSKRWKEMIGYTEDEFENNYEAWGQHLHPDDKESTLTALKDYFDGRSTVFNVEYRMRCKDGDWKWILARGKVVGRDANGQPLRMIGTHADISERKKAEEVIQAASQYSRSLIEASQDPLVTISAEGKITDVNTATERVTGVERTNLIGSDFADYFTDPEKARKGYQQVFSQGFVIDYPLAIRHESGKVTDVLYNASVYRDGNGNVLGVFAAARDITAYKRAETTRMQLAAIVEFSNDAIVGKTTDGIINSWNQGAERIYGYTADEIIGKPITTLAPPSHHAEIHELLEKIRNGGAVLNHETERIRKDGTLIHVALTLSPIRDASGNISGISTIARDITELKKAEEELKRYKDHLEEEVQQRTTDLVLARNAAEAANRAKSMFLSSMSHELRTPLNAILGFSGMMRKDPLLPQEQRENIDIINRSGEHLLTLINDVLEMAKIEAGRVQLESVSFDLGCLVRDVADMMHMRAQEKGLQLLIDQSSEFPRYIKGDEARLRQVLINLVGNAVKFTQQGGITVRLGLNATQQHLLIEVEDSGIGIKPEDQQKIYEPFVQLGQTTTQKGTGLGLTITRQFVQLMGGTISLESTPGKGSTFRVELPVERVAASDVAKPGRAVKGDIVGLAPNQPEYRILVVEDQLENQMLLTQLMKKVGFPVKVAENGEQALELFQNWRPHLIWMDRRMPVMDGLEATRRIRELPGGKEVKIVAVTASAFMEQRDEMFKAGMDDFVRKPYRFNEIYECLTKQLGVQYTYADAQAPEEVSDVVLTAEMLTVLPQALRRELHDALESLEGERITAVIQQVASHDSTLHKTLSHLAENFDYPAILKALQTNHPVNDI